MDRIRDKFAYADPDWEHNRADWYKSRNMRKPDDILTRMHFCSRCGVKVELTTKREPRRRFHCYCGGLLMPEYGINRNA